MKYTLMPSKPVYVMAKSISKLTCSDLLLTMGGKCKLRFMDAVLANIAVCPIHMSFSNSVSKLDVTKFNSYVNNNNNVIQKLYRAATKHSNYFFIKPSR
jgi:hypothetical protein